MPPPRTRTRQPPQSRHLPQSRPPPSRPLLGPGTPRDQAPPPRTRHPPSPGTRHPLPRQQTATVADGTHPTGMHSCCLLNFNYVSLSNIELDLLFHWPNLCSNNNNNNLFLCERYKYHLIVCYFYTFLLYPCLNF